MLVNYFFLYFFFFRAIFLLTLLLLFLHIYTKHGITQRFSQMIYISTWKLQSLINSLYFLFFSSFIFNSIYNHRESCVSTSKQLMFDIFCAIIIMFWRIFGVVLYFSAKMRGKFRFYYLFRFREFIWFSIDFYYLALCHLHFF